MIFTSFAWRYKALVVGFVVAAQAAFAQVPDLKTPLSKVLPIDKELRIGKLENGLSYYIRKNKRPEKQAIIELVVKAGSLHEQDHEQGLAHFLEHTVFKGSKHFQDQKEFNNYFSSRGVQFAADNNAFTSFDKTGYFFVIPTDDQDLTDKTFAALGDFAGRAFLKQEAIDGERDIILDELQMRDSSQLRQMRALLPVLMRGTDYHHRIPSGLKEVVSTASAETIRNFYATWYNPSNMAIVAVGDFDPDNVLQLIKKHCGEQRDHVIKSTRKVKTKPKPQHGEVVFFVDRENVTSSLQVFFDQGNVRTKTVGDVRGLVARNLAMAIVEQRMAELSFQPSAATQGMGCAFIQDLFKDFACSLVVSGFKQNRAADATTELIACAKQAADHGIVGDELAVAKKTLISRNQQLIANVDALPHGFFKGAYDTHIMQGEYGSIASIADVAALSNVLIEDVSEADVVAAMRSLLDFNKAVYLFAFDEKGYADAGGKDGEAALRRIIIEKSTASTEAYVPAAQVKEVGSVTTGVAQVRSIEDIPSIGAQKIVLANGITVYFKHASFTENVVNIVGLATGGMDAIQDDAVLATLVTPAIAAMGVGGVKPFQWNAILSDKPGLNVATGMSLHARSVAAGCRREDLAFCLNLMIVNMIQPNADAELFNVFATNMKNSIRDMQNSPQALFSQKNNEIIFGHPTFFKMMTEAAVDKVSLDDAVNLYHRSFDDVSDFTFAVCGNIALEELVAQLNQTLAMVAPSHNDQWKAQPVALSFPAGASRVEFERKSEQQTSTAMTFPFAVQTTKANERLMEIFEIALNARLFDVVRLDNSKCYTAHAYAVKMNDLFYGQHDTTGRLCCGFSSSKENIAAVTDLIVDLMRDIKANGLRAEEVAHAKKVAQNHLQQNFKANHPWVLYMLDCHLRRNGEFDSVETLGQMIDDISVEEVNAFVQPLIDPEHYFAHSLVAAN